MIHRRLAALLRTIRSPGRAAVVTSAAIAVAAVTAVYRAPVPAYAQTAGEAGKPAAAGVFSPEQKAAIESIIKEYFLANPEAFLEIQTALEAKMEKIQADKMKVALKENAAEIFKNPNAPVAGNPNGDITVVEFFDYNCGYCKRAFQDVAKAVEKDTKLKLVLKELPILSKGSEEAARIALAARAQGKYWDVHRALITIRGEVNEQSALRTVEKIPGIDMARLKRDMESPEIKAHIVAVRELAQKMGIQGTPHFLVGDRSIAGAPGNLLEQINTNVNELRKSGCSVC